MNTTQEEKINVLFVDDEQVNLDTYKMNFRRTLNVRTALSAAEARKILEFEVIDVVVSDQRMPETTGVEFLTRVREQWPDVVSLQQQGVTAGTTTEDGRVEGATGTPGRNHAGQGRF